MPENLESVEQTFLANLAPYLAALDSAIAKATEFAGAAKLAEDAVAAMAVSAADAAVVVDAAMGSATKSVAALALAMAGLDSKHIAVTASVSGISGPVAGAVAQVEALKAAMAGLSGATVRVSADVAGAGAAAGAAGARFGMWAGGLRLTGAALHWIVMGTLEILSTAVPALVAFGAAVAGMAPTFVSIKDAMSNLVISSGGMRGALLNSVAPLHNLGVNFGVLRQQMAPDAYVIFGAAINSLTGHFGAFSQMARSAGNVLAAFATKLSAELSGPMGAQLVAFFANGVKYMIQWGQVLGNLGHTFLNVMGAMPGVGQLLLDVLVAISRALLAISSNPAGRFFLEMAAAISAAYRYAQLLVTILGFVLRSLTGIPGAVAKLSASIVALGAGVRAFAVSVATGFMGAIRWVAGYAAALAALAVEEGVVAAATLVMSDLIAAATGPIGIAVMAIGAAIGIWWLATRNVTTATGQMIAKIQAASPTAAHLTAGVQQLTNSLARLALHQRQLSADQALYQQNVVQTENALRQQMREYLNLIAGLSQMHAGLGLVAAGEAALGIQTALADSKIQQLNQALDQYMQLVTGGTAGLAGFVTSLANIGQVAGTTANNLGTATGTMTLSVTQFAKALNDQLSVKGASAWTNFDQIVGSTMPQFMDWFRQAAVLGATTGVTVTQSALDMASAMVKYAGSNQNARATLLAFVQAQGLNIKTWPALLAALQLSGASMQNLTGNTNATTQALSNLSAMAKNAANAVTQEAAKAMAVASLKTSGFDAALNKLTSDLESGHASRAQIQQDIANLNRAEALAAAQAARWGGTTASAAAQIQSAFDRALSSAQRLQAFINSMHGKAINISINYAYAVTGGGPLTGGGKVQGGNVVPAAQHGTPSAPRGPMLLAEAGIELLVGPQVRMMRGGEQVIPAGQTAALLSAAASLARAGSSRPAGMSPGGGGGGTVVHNHYYNVTVNNAGSVIAQQDLSRHIVAALARQSFRNPTNQLAFPGRGH